MTGTRKLFWIGIFGAVTMTVAGTMSAWALVTDDCSELLGGNCSAMEEYRASKNRIAEIGKPSAQHAGEQADIRGETSSAPAKPVNREPEVKLAQAKVSEPRTQPKPESGEELIVSREDMPRTRAPAPNPEPVDNELEAPELLVSHQEEPPTAEARRQLVRIEIPEDMVELSEPSRAGRHMQGRDLTPVMPKSPTIEQAQAWAQSEHAVPERAYGVQYAAYAPTLTPTQSEPVRLQIQSGYTRAQDVNASVVFRGIENEAERVCLSQLNYLPAGHPKIGQCIGAEVEARVYATGAPQVISFFESLLTP